MTYEEVKGKLTDLIAAKKIEKHGAYMTFSEEEHKTFYDVYNSFSEGDGVPLADFFKFGIILRAAVVKAKEAEAGAKQ